LFRKFLFLTEVFVWCFPFFSVFLLSFFFFSGQLITDRSTTTKQKQQTNTPFLEEKIAIHDSVPNGLIMAKFNFIDL